MAVVTSGNIIQSADGTILTFQDTTTGLVAPVTRTLSVFDINGNLVTPRIVMTGTTAEINITSDVWLSFIEFITDANGQYTLTINYQSFAFYQNAFANAVAGQSCLSSDYFDVFFNLGVSQDFYQAALRQFAGGFGITSQNLMAQAYLFATTPYYVLNAN